MASSRETPCYTIAKGVIMICKIKCSDCGWVGVESETINRIMPITDRLANGITLQTSTIEEQCPKCLSIFLEEK